MTTTTDHEVLVVGAGPTGLVLAAQLLARGVPTRIVDKAPEPAPWSKALGIHARTLEMFDTMGITDRFLDVGHRVRHFRMYAVDRPLLDLRYTRNGSPYGFALHLPQADTEALLRERVAELGGTIERGLELVSVGQDGEAAHAVLADATGRRTSTTAQFVVGCDGAHSRVRKDAGISFDGEAYEDAWVLADVTVDGVGADDSIHGFFRSDGLPLVCLPMGGGRWRLTLPEPPGQGAEPPTLDLVQEYVDQRSPRPVRMSDPVWITRFRAQLRRAGAYRSGRLLLAGDAAHIHSPAGAQGMNTGLLDAHNLAWKLALVLEGRAGEGLLDSYGHERRPVAAQVVGLSDRIVRVSMLRRPAARAVRDVALPVLTGLPPVQARAARRLSQVAISYPDGPLVARGARGVRGAGPAPGERAPDVALAPAEDPDRLWSRLGAGRHLLLAATDLAVTELAAAVAAAGIDRSLVDVVVAGEDQPWPRRGRFALVRPDGVLAARGRCADLGPATAYLRRLVGEPAQPATDRRSSRASTAAGLSTASSAIAAHPTSPARSPYVEGRTCSSRVASADARA